MDFHFRPHEKLKSSIQINHVFENGKRYHHYPLLFLVAPLPRDHTLPELQKNQSGIQAGFTVSKKKFKKAVDRNRIKRLMREAYRLQKHKLCQIHQDMTSGSTGITMIYIGHQIPQYSTIFDSVTQFIDQYADSVQ